MSLLSLIRPNVLYVQTVSPGNWKLYSKKPINSNTKFWNLRQKKNCYEKITEVIYVSILCLAGIHGNTVVNLETNNTPNDPVYNCAKQCTYFRYLVLKYILKRWYYSGGKQINNKLHEILSVSSKTHCCYGNNSHGTSGLDHMSYW